FDFDDDVFVSKAERIIPEQAPYIAKEETDGWFHSFNDYESLMLERHGPNQLKSAIEHDYLYKRYERALTGALKYIELADSGHCKCGRPGDAVSALVRYHKLRRLDYHAWHLLAIVMYSDDNPGSMRNHVAQAAVQRAIKTMTSSQWSLHIDQVRRRYERELEQLNGLARQISAQQGSIDPFFTWMQPKQGLSKEELRGVGMEVFNAEDIEFIYTTCARHQDTDADE
ncbi:hypothetical protein BJV82DRAFT_496243, partial [Fennellomyces sp. T-0311]